jgi:hypothetical protein
MGLQWLSLLLAMVGVLTFARVWRCVVLLCTLSRLEDTKILENLTESQRRVVRACVKNGILATDMGRHGAIMNGFKESM